MKKIQIQHKKVGQGEPVFIIAEIGMNHDGSLGQAKCLIEVASEAGADAVKFQAHIAEAETLRDAPTPPYFGEEPRFEYFRRTSFDRPRLQKLKEHAEARGLVFLCSPFSILAVDLLEELHVAAYKIPSGEVTNLPLLEHVAAKGKPVILSSGMSNVAELEEAISAIRKFNRDVILLQCSSEYPCPYDRVGLSLIREFAGRFDLPVVGLSDHTPTIYTAIGAVALGACAIEKHFALSRRMYGPDARFSLVPEEFKELVDGVRAVEAALLPLNKDDTGRFDEMRRVFQKSIVSLVDIPKGARLEEGMISTKKPGTGLSPRYFREIIGKKVLQDIRKDSLLHEQDVEW